MHSQGRPRQRERVVSRSRREYCQRDGCAGRPRNLLDHLIQRSTANVLTVDPQNNVTRLQPGPLRWRAVQRSDDQDVAAFGLYFRPNPWYLFFSISAISFTMGGLRNRLWPVSPSAPTIPLIAP